MLLFTVAMCKKRFIFTIFALIIENAFSIANTIILN